MTLTAVRKVRTLAIHPMVGGFGWAVLEGPLAPHDWGVARLKVANHDNCLRRVERLLDQFLPETVVLEAFEPPNGARCTRVVQLFRSIVALARDRGSDISVYDRDHVYTTFSGLGSKLSRQAIAEAVGRHISLLTTSVPKPRRPWEGERPMLAVFSAMAVALTHYRLSCDVLLKDLYDDAT